MSELPTTLNTVDDVAAVCLAHGLTRGRIEDERTDIWENERLAIQTNPVGWEARGPGYYADFDWGAPSAILVAAIDAARGEQT